MVLVKFLINIFFKHLLKLFLNSQMNGDNRTLSAPDIARNNTLGKQVSYFIGIYKVAFSPPWAGGGRIKMLAKEYQVGKRKGRKGREWKEKGRQGKARGERREKEIKLKNWRVGKGIKLIATLYTPGF